MSSDDVESLKATVNEVINEKKRTGIWDPYHWQTTLALIAALRLPDSSIADHLMGQGAELSTRSLLSVVQKGNAKLLKFVIKELQKAGTWWPEDWYTGLALAEAWFFERKKLYIVFEENDVVFMPEWVVTAVKYGDIGLIVKLVHGLKATNRWDPNDPFIVRAITEAIKEEANIWYYCLLQEGARPAPQHLVTAIRRGDCNILKDIIQHLKKQSLWKNNEYSKDIMLALEEACLKKDITSYATLIEEGADPDFHCLLTAIKSNYCQLAAKIVRDLKLCGKWNSSALQNDWSLMLARDYISKLPDGARQRWENLIFGSTKAAGQKGIEFAHADETNVVVTEAHRIIKEVSDFDVAQEQYDEPAETANDEITKAPPNTPIERAYGISYVHYTRSEVNGEEINEKDTEMYRYEEPTEETLYRCLQRSVSAPVAPGEYGRNGDGKQILHKKRHPTEPGDIESELSDGDLRIFFPSTETKSFEETDNATDRKKAAKVDQIMPTKNNEMVQSTNRENESPVEVARSTDAHIPVVSTDYNLSTDVHTGLRENREGENTHPWRTPREPAYLLPRPSYYSARRTSRYTARTHYQGQNDPEIIRLRRQFSFSIRSISLTTSYVDHLRYISSLKFH